MWQIAFPLMLDFFGVVVILQFLYILSGAAENVILLTNGGPGTATLTLGFTFITRLSSPSVWGTARPLRS